MKDKQIGELIDKLTTMSTTRSGDTFNNDRNTKREREEGGGGSGGGGRGGGGRRGGGRGGGGDRTEPKYTQKYKAIDGGGKRIDYKTIAFSKEWDYQHQNAWKRSKLYDKNYEQW